MKRLYVYDIVSPRYVLIRGGPNLSGWLREQGIPAVRAPLDRGFKLQRDRRADLLAAAQDDHVSVNLRPGDAA